MGFKEAWASMNLWERRQAMLGGIFIAGAAALYVDTEFVRPEHFREQWREKREQRGAEELCELLRPEMQPSSSKQRDGSKQPEAQRSD